MKEEMLQEFMVMKTLVEDTRETNPRERDSRNLKEVPKFSGNIGENLDDWLFIIEAGIKQEKVSSEKVIGLITPALRGCYKH
jgi:hypothetical protein